MKNNVIMVLSVVLVILLIVLGVNALKKSDVKKEMSEFIQEKIIKSSDYAIDYKISGALSNKITINYKDSFDYLDIQKQDDSLVAIKNKIETYNKDVLTKHNMFSKLLKPKNKFNLIIKTSKNEYVVDYIDYFYKNGKHYAYTDQFINYPPTPSSTQTSSSNYEIEPIEEEKGFAWAVAKTTIKENLKSPSSAKFPFSYYQQYIKEVSPKTFVVKSYVDADNSFGAKIRNNFMVKFERIGEDTYKVLDVQIYE